MKRESIERMSDEELEQYARLLGVILDAAHSRDEKISLVERKREKRVTVTALGIDFDITIRRVRDKRVSDLLARGNRTDEETDEAIRLLLGDGQYQTLLDAVTDDDGVVDVDAMGLAFVRIITADELKNS